MAGQRPSLAAGEPNKNTRSFLPNDYQLQTATIMAESQRPGQPVPKRQEPDKTEAFEVDTDSLGAGHETPAGLTAPFVDGAADEDAADLIETGDWASSVEDRQGIKAKADRPRPAPVPGYEILDELGRGGLGIVYRARQKGLKRLVALKMILAGSHAGGEELARFQIEAEAVANLQHANIVQIHDVGEHQGIPYIALEYVDGGGLDHKLARKLLEDAEAAELVETLGRAIDYAHRKGVIHRDLKPANVLLTAEGVPKIADFGLAKRLEEDSGQTRTGAVMGTPSFMAPEQARGAVDEIGPLADVYALGAILYCVLTGRPPFTSSSPVETIRQVLFAEPVPPTRLQPKVHPDLETICLKCLQKDPRKRYPSGEELADDLLRFREGKPILARPVGTPERVWRWCRRNPRVAIPSAAAMLLALTLMIGGPAAAIAVNREKNTAIVAQDQAEENERQAKASEQEAIDERKKALASEQEALDAREEARANEQEAVEARKTAAAQGRFALDTINTLVRDVQDELKHQPQLQALRQRLLKSALGGLDLVAANGVDADQKDLLMAAAYRRLGDIYLELGQSEKALDQYGLCCNIVDELGKNQTLPNYHHNLSSSYSNMGEAARRSGNPSLAADHFRKALGVRREWAVETPTNKYIPQNIAESLGKLGGTSLMMGQVTEAHKFYSESLRLREEWVEWAPANPDAKQELAGAYNAMARTTLRQGKLDDSVTYAQKARDLLSQILETRPQDSDLRGNTALFSNQLANVCLMGGKTQRAIEAYSSALPLLENLLQRDPQNALWRRSVIETSYGLGAAYDRLGQPEAAEHFTKALELRRQLVEEDVNNVDERTGLVLALGRCGEFRQAAEIADTLLAENAQNAHVLYNLATGYAVCAAAVARVEDDSTETADLLKKYTAAAVNALRAAVEQGYEVAIDLRLDPDLDGIRDRDEFRKLLDSNPTSDDLPPEQD